MAAKYIQLAELLKVDLLKRAESGGKLPTEQQLQQRYHLSRQTVRKALELLEQEGLIVRRQGSGSFVAGQDNEPQRQVAIVLSFYDDYIFPSLLRDATNLLSRQGCQVSVYTTENSVSAEREILQSLLRQRVSAVLIEGSKTALPSPNAELFDKLRSSGASVLFLHGMYGNVSGFPCISDDNFAGGQMLAEYLIAKGHTRISGIFKSDDIQGPQRYHGYAAAMLKAGLKVNGHCLCWYDTEDRRRLIDDEDLSLIRRYISERMSGSTAVICYNDEIANQLIKELLAQGIRVPEDVAVVSFDNSYYTQICPVQISSLAHKADRMGIYSAKALLSMLDGEEVSSKSLGWTLIERESS